jgi:hypothetical protein
MDTILTFRSCLSWNNFTSIHICYEIWLSETFYRFWRTSSFAKNCFRDIESIMFLVGTVMGYPLNLKLWLGKPICQPSPSGRKVCVLNTKLSNLHIETSNAYVQMCMHMATGWKTIWPLAYNCNIHKLSISELVIWLRDIQNEMSCFNLYLTCMPSNGTFINIPANFLWLPYRDVCLVNDSYLLVSLHNESSVNKKCPYSVTDKVYLFL